MRPLASWSCLVLLVALCCPTLARDRADDLASYRAFARSADGPRLLAIARVAAETRRSASIASSDSAPPPCWPGAPTGVYVSLAAGRATRACVGSPAPTHGGLSETIADLAVQVLSSDVRRPPVRPEELSRLRVVISFAGEGEAIASPYDARPGAEGLLVSSPRGSVAFLPGEARTVAWALTEARRIGVIQGAAADVTYRRFPVVALSEPEVHAPPSRPRAPDEDEVIDESVPAAP